MDATFCAFCDAVKLTREFPGRFFPARTACAIALARRGTRGLDDAWIVQYKALFARFFIVQHG